MPWEDGAENLRPERLGLARNSIKWERSTERALKSFYTTLSIINRSNRQKLSKNVKDLNNYINQIDLIDNYRTHCPQTKKT